ncbi:hypothetical protein FHT44_004938 [Mycolicibacterium sp. BK634]|uniref:hypothetical protein n=1 Tax=Mycolicibacterium sp. BK634 TaxID=2587099 RepID=UPI00160F9369|nr:hypothetical protein [Mycolicibacterium sp. BK634]MBB3752426.1 hypothetical protein [Mycolicibacterium sp. BK634]
MAVLIVIAAVVIMAALWFFIRETLDGDPIFGLGIAAFTLVGGSVLGSLVALIATLSLSPIVGYHYTYQSQPLVTLTDERNSLGGQFFLGTGYISEGAVYTFYTDDGGYRSMHQTGVGGVRVYEDSPKPYVVWETGCESDHPGIVFCVGSSSRKLVEIHVPPASIKTGISMGAR